MSDTENEAVGGISVIDAAPTSAGGFLERQQLFAWCEDASERSMDDISFSLAFSSWRLASIVGGVRSRSVRGAMGGAAPDCSTEAFVTRIDASVGRAAAYAEEVV